MAGFHIRIDFYGLIGLVPTGDGRFLLPLPDLREGLERAPLPARVPPHLPCVVVPRKHCPEQPEENPQCRPKKWDLEFQRRRKEVRRLFRFELERLTLEYSGTGSGASIISTPLDPSVHKKPGPSAPRATDLAWMPSLKHTGIPGADQFDARLLGHDYVPGIDEPSNRLVGTVLLDSGALSSSGVVPDGKEEDAAVYEFIPAGEPSSPAFSQAMFRNMVWRGSGTGDSLELVFIDVDQEQRRLRLEPKKGRIDLDVFNWELEDILGIGSGTHSPKPNLDPDFAVSYWMSKAWDKLAGGQPVIPKTPPQGTGGSGEACKVGKFSGIS